jgi:aerobic C4-dicarboxylate transport protein
MTPDPHATGQRDTLYLQVLVAIAAGVVLGVVAPEFASSLKPLGDTFVRIIKMLIAPIVFLTVGLGIASVGDLRRVGRVGIKALLYFEGMSTLALVIGLVMVHAIQPGAGIHADVSSLDVSELESTTHGRENTTLVEHLTGIVPNGFVSAFTSDEILQVLFVAILFGLALASAGPRAKPVLHGMEALGVVFFRVVALVMRLAPIGAFGAMAYTVGHFGFESLFNLGKLMLGFYATALLFVIVVLGLVLKAIGLSIFQLLRYIRAELLIVLGTSSSESVLPQLMDKLEGLGCSPSVVRLVVPTGYSFNLDGTSIYLTMAAVFVAQATDTELTWTQEAALLGVLLLTSKGAAAVTGGGFVTLAATLQSTRTVPVAGLSLLLGIDRFMSEARALTNLVGNTVATLVVAHWEGELDLVKTKRLLAMGAEAAAAEAAAAEAAATAAAAVAPESAA